MFGLGLRWAGAVALVLIAGCAPQGGPRMGAPRVPALPADPPLSAEVTVPISSLLDARGQDLVARFGEPGQRRRDGGAEVWNYEAPGLCRLNLVMQRQRGTQLVVHAQARMARGGTEMACVGGLEKRR